MPKRKAGSHAKKSDNDAGKRTRQAEPAAPSSAAESSHLNAQTVACASLAPHITFHTHKLIDAIQATGGSFTQRVQAVVDRLKVDALRFVSLLDLSLMAEGDEVGSERRAGRPGQATRSVHISRLLIVALCSVQPRVAVAQSCVLFRLLRFFASCCFNDEAGADVRADKYAAQQLILACVLQLLPKLLLSFNPATADAATGDNALHVMGTLFNLCIPYGFDFKLTQQLIIRGVSVHQRNKKGRTPSLHWAAHSIPQTQNVNMLGLLLACGADLNAQDDDGNGVLHHLVQRGALAAMENLLERGNMSHLDHFLRNSDGQTATDLAAIQVAQRLRHGWGPSRASILEQRIHRLLTAQSEMWTQRVAPVLLLLCLDEVLPVTDLAKLALGYIDGSGLPFTSAGKEEEEDEEGESEAAQGGQPSSSAAAAAAAHS